MIFEYEGYTLSGPSDDPLVQTLKNRDNPETQSTEIIRDVVKPGAVCADIGAHIGYHTIDMLNAGASMVDAFEPYLKNYEHLTKMVRQNNLHSSVHPWNVAISDRIRTIGMIVYRDNDIVTAEPQGPPEMEAASEFLSLAVPLSILDKDLDFVKVDIEGHELMVIDTFPTERITTMLIELHDFAYGPQQKQAFMEYLSDRYEVSEVSHYHVLCEG